MRVPALGVFFGGCSNGHGGGYKIYLLRLSNGNLLRLSNGNMLRIR